ncbi:hypothetical protein NDU88_002395 [Pleurodeles waltl]|uniref:Uncharacterized protein n=1 Tax=Pleurodeles waltl TaxID=8319 RepID=A0AAV7M378_PLEWA|nr:hypothetical protein NDU88_002395 [Pleurodeles waltl]
MQVNEEVHSATGTLEPQEPRRVQILAAMEQTSHELEHKRNTLMLEVNLVTADPCRVNEWSLVTEKEVQSLTAEVAGLWTRGRITTDCALRLQDKLEDLKGRSRWRYLSFAGFGERAEGAVPQLFLEC